MGDGNFKLQLNASIIKAIGTRKGSKIEGQPE
jgi:hypothetical protein